MRLIILNQNIQKTIGLVIIFLAFMMSIYIRLPYLGRPFGDQHEWATAHTLIALDIIQLNGMKNTLFRNIQTYPGEMNRFITWVTTRVVDSKGISYYTSYPPFTLIFTYWLFLVLHLPISIMSVELLNIFLHFISAMILFLCLYELLESKYKVVWSILGSVMHIYLIPNLWFFLKVYSWDTLWYYFWILEIYIFILLIKKIRVSKHIFGLLFQLSMVNFITIFTNPAGVYFASGVFLYSYIQSKSYSSYKRILLPILLSSIAPFIIFIAQNITISGMAPFIENMVYKIFVEYGTFGIYPQGGSIYTVLGYVRLYFSPFFPLTVFLLLCYIFGKIPIRKLISNNQKVIVLLMFIPGLLHFIIFLPDFITHEFILLKFSIFISITFPVLLSLIENHMVKYRGIFVGIVIFIFIHAIVFSTIVYKEIYVKQFNQNRYVILGNQIRNTLLNDDVGFLSSSICLNPQLIYYVKRNLQFSKTSSEAENWLRTHKRKNGKLYTSNDNCLLQSITPVVTE